MGTSSTRRALIVGGGIAGMSTAITLGKIGMAVDLIDLDPHWRVYGAGISITGPTLRAFGALGILDAVRREGFTGDGIQVCDAQGAPSHVVPTPIVADDDVPGSGGIMRPVLHRILSEKTLAAVLVFVGSKIFVADMLGIAKIPPALSLGVTIALLAAGIFGSMWATRNEKIAHSS